MSQVWPGTCTISVSFPVFKEMAMRGSLEESKNALTVISYWKRSNNLIKSEAGIHDSSGARCGSSSNETLVSSSLEMLTEDSCVSTTFSAPTSFSLVWCLCLTSFCREPGMPKVCSPVFWCLFPGVLLEGCCLCLCYVEVFWTEQVWCILGEFHLF